MRVSVAKRDYDVLKTMTDDLMKAEYFINEMGVETRTDLSGDEFRPIQDILKDIVTVVNNNPSILDDCVVYLSTNPTTSDDTKEFQSKYNLDGIFKIESKFSDNRRIKIIKDSNCKEYLEGEEYVVISENEYPAIGLTVIDPENPDEEIIVNHGDYEYI